MFNNSGFVHSLFRQHKNIVRRSNGIRRHLFYAVMLLLFIHPIVSNISKKVKHSLSNTPRELIDKFTNLTELK